MDLLDDLMPDPVLRTHHRRDTSAAPDDLWAAAQALTLRDAGPLGRLVRLRIPGTPEDARFGELFRRYPFCVLEEGERHVVSGLAGRIWTLRRDYPTLAGREDFEAWDRPGTSRVVFAHGVEEEAGRSVVWSEARVDGTDRLARLQLRALWAVVGRFERLVASHGLAMAVRRAESRPGTA